MANNDILSPASYGIDIDSDVTRSVTAEEFLNWFAFGDAELHWNLIFINHFHSGYKMHTKFKPPRKNCDLLRKWTGRLCVSKTNTQ
jgi:hypothetical protein